jgi:hypothetical protein
MKAPALTLPILAACALLGGPVAANAGPYVATLNETAQGVVTTASGAIVVGYCARPTMAAEMLSIYVGFAAP